MQSLFFSFYRNAFFNGIEAIEEKQAQTDAPEEPALLLLSCRSDEKFCFLELEDHGIGMTGEELARATEAFFTTKERGTGLGLTLSRQYTIDNGGEMNVVSVKGSFTRITLKFERYFS